MKGALADRFPYALVTLVVVVVDQVTKRIVDRGLALHESVDVIPGVFSLTYVRNRGAAFGILSGAELPYQAALFSAVSLAALLAILYYAMSLPVSARRPQIALALIAGGAIGNLIDRVSLSYVIDFLDFYWNSHHWPMFNAADTCISIGVGLLVLDILLSPADAPAMDGAPAAEAD